MIFNITPNLISSILAIIGVLIFFQVLAQILSFVKKDKDFSNLKIRLKSWWLIISFIAFILLFKSPVNYIFTGILCFLALREFFGFLDISENDKPLRFWAYLTIPIEMYFLYIGWLAMFYLFVPLYMFMFIPIRKIFSGKTENFIKSSGTIQWGLVLTVYSLGYVGAFLLLPFNTKYSLNGAELLLFLLILNSMNDGFQYIWGKLFGKNKIVPHISPNKTWEGFIGGVLTTVVISVIAAPHLTPMNPIMAVCAGLMISVFGFLGDVVMSAVKRDVGVKDSSHLIPGHGGILDRVDSLIFTAPLFFHFICYFFK